MEASISYNWSTEVFQDFYNSVRIREIPDKALLKSIKDDLLVVLAVPKKNEASKARLIDERSPVQFSNGEEFKLNKEFVEAALQLSFEVNVDEILAAEILYEAQNFEYEKGTNFLDSGRLAFFSRYEYILNILIYLAATGNLGLVVEDKYDIFFDRVLASFEKLYDTLSVLNTLIDKQKHTDGINNLQFISSINYIKSQVFRNHELLGQLLFSLLDSYNNEYCHMKFYFQVVNHIKKNLSDRDLLLIHYIPSLLKFINEMERLPEEEVIEFHKKTTEALLLNYENILTNEVVDLSKSGLRFFEILLALFMLTSLIAWCKKSPSRTNKFDFRKDIMKYIEICICCGAAEILLCISAETSELETRRLLEMSNTYNFRSLLQVNFPDFCPEKFIYPNADDLWAMINTKQPCFSNVSKLLDCRFRVSQDFSENLVVPFLHAFFQGFISNAAIILSLLRDSEEDFLLSLINRKQLEYEEKSRIEASEGNQKRRDSVGRDSSDSQGDTDASIDLDEIASRADLERLYLSFVYVYNNRQNICTLFWENDEMSNDVTGFISWGLSNNTSPLITATFCLVLGSLTSAGDNMAIRVWEILFNNNVPMSNSLKRKDFSRISMDSIVESLRYYISALNSNYANDLSKIIKLSQKRQELFFTSGFTNIELNDTGTTIPQHIMIELSEDSCVFISGFVQLVSFIVRNLSSINERSVEIKNLIFDQFRPLICAFLGFDNLIVANKSENVATSLKNSNTNDSPLVYVKDDNRVVLVNLMLNLLSDFTYKNDNLVLRYKVWEIVDRWIYQSMDSDARDKIANNSAKLIGFQNTTKPSSFKDVLAFSKQFITRRLKVNINEGFTLNLSQLSLVTNFTKLMKNLFLPLQVESNYAFSSYKLLFPANLGEAYRPRGKIGIWPYIEFLLVEVFANLDKLSLEEERFNLKLLIIEILENSLNEIDWVFLIEEVPQIVPSIKSLDPLFDSITSEQSVDYPSFVKLHQSLAVMNYMFNENAYAVIFNIIDRGSQTDDDEAYNVFLEKALSVLESVLKLQDVFSHRLLSILKNEDNSADQKKSAQMSVKSKKANYDNFYFPKLVGTNGVSDFYEIILFHLTTIASLALFVGSLNLKIAGSSINILRRITSSSFFNSKSSTNASDAILGKNKVLTIFESVDESIRIQYAFIQQFERFIDGPRQLEVKINMLNFLKKNLTEASNEPGVSHFLLGFEIRGDRLSLEDVISKKTLLSSMLTSLYTSLDLISEIDYENGNVQVIDLTATKIALLVLEIIMKLTSDPISSSPTLRYLRHNTIGDKDLFEKLIECQPKVGPNTRWHGIEFDGDIQNGKNNYFLQESIGPLTLVSFIHQRNLVLQYLSLELHSISRLNSITKKERYSRLLLNDSEFYDGTPKILNFLDVMNYRFFNFEVQKHEKFSGKYNLPVMLNMVKNHEGSCEEIIDFSVLQKMYKFICRQANPSLTTREAKVSFLNNVMLEASEIADFLTKFTISQDLKTAQLSNLHAWVQLIQILVSSSDLPSSRKSNLILEIIQVILPKINDYLELDVSFSEELISLCVLLFDLYEEDVLTTEENDRVVLNIERLLPLFKTCVNGITCSTSTPDLRSDLYVLSTKFLQRSMKVSELSRKLIALLRLLYSRFIDTVTNDSICAEGSSRVTSLLFLESLLNLSSTHSTNFVLELMIKNNSLSLLVRSLKRSDEMITLYSGWNQHKAGDLSIDTLLYELTAFKTTLYLLIRVALTRLGSSQLIQNEIFSVIKQCKFLAIDPDLGIDLRVSEFNDDYYHIDVHLSLDTPITLSKSSSSFSAFDEQLSYFEFLVPTFQLISAVLLSMGPSYKPTRIQAKDIFNHFERLIVGVMKRDVLLESKQLTSTQYSENSISRTGLKELLRLIILLDALSNYESEHK